MVAFAEEEVVVQIADQLLLDQRAPEDKDS
jgi:hypothetical protein